MTTASSPEERAIHAAAKAALDLVPEHSTVGLGTGRAATAFIALLGELVRRDFRISCVATSIASARAASSAGIALVPLTEHTELELTVDGADEVAPNLDLIKGWGGALVQERIVAAASRRQVIIVGSEKLVPHLGQRGCIPVEVIPMAEGLAVRRLKALGLKPVVRVAPSDSRPLLTENRNLTLDCRPRAPLADGAAARSLEAAIRAIPGVVDTGLFLGTAERVLVGFPDGRVETLLRHRAADG